MYLFGDLSLPMADPTPRSDNVGELRSLPDAFSLPTVSQRMLSGEASVVAGGSGAFDSRTITAFSLGDFTTQFPGEALLMALPTSFPIFILLRNFFREIRVSDLAITAEAVGDLTASGFRVRTAWSTSQIGPITETGLELENYLLSLPDNSSFHFNQFAANSKPHYCSFTQTPYQVSPESLVQGVPVVAAAFFNAANAGNPRVRYRITGTLHLAGFRMLSSSPTFLIGQTLAGMTLEHRDQLTRSLFKMCSPSVLNEVVDSLVEVDDDVSSADPKSRVSTRAPSRSGKSGKAVDRSLLAKVSGTSHITPE